MGRSLPSDRPERPRAHYEAIIRINSQSGKGGVAYLLLSEYRLDLPRGLQVEFSQTVQAITDAEGGELSAAELYDLFNDNYLSIGEPYELCRTGTRRVTRRPSQRGPARRGQERRSRGQGNGPIAALDAWARFARRTDDRRLDYHEHALGSGEDATAAAYVRRM